MSDEQWRAVVGYEGLYEVSDQGRVRSLARRAPRGLSSVPVKARVLSPQLSRNNHLTVRISNGATKTVYVHTLVLVAFVGPKPSSLMCRHLDGDPTNNTLGNLAWGTSSENKFDQVRHGVDGMASKDRCKWGHIFDEANTYHRLDRINRICRTCARERARRKAA